MITDIKNNLMQALAMMAAVTGNAVANGSAIDTSRSLAAMFTLSAPIYSDGTYTFTIQESADNSTWAEIAEDKYIGKDEVNDVISAVSSAGDPITSIGCFSVNKYIRLVCTPTGVSTGATIVSHVVLKPELRPSDYVAVS